MDPAVDLSPLASPDPRPRFAAEEALKAAGPAGIAQLATLLARDDVPPALRRRAEALHGVLVREASYDAFVSAVPDPAAADLWHGAVAIAAEGHPALDTAALDRRLDDLVAGARSATAGGDGVEDVVSRLNRYLFDEQGFKGDRATYDDPRNSWMPDVLDRRRGIPVTLAVLWIEVARRLGLPAAGVGLPLHFVARCEGAEGPLYVDAFGGEVLDRAGCVRLVAEAAGREVALPDAAFRPLRAGEVLVRMLRNLRGRHERDGDWEGALSALDRSLHVTPLDAHGWRDRAVVLARLSRPGAAARSLSRALALEPGATDRPAIEGLRRRLQRDAASRN